MDRSRRSLPELDYDEYRGRQETRVPATQTPPKKRKTEDSATATARMRQRHREEATEMTRLTNELATLKRDIVPTAQLNRTIEKQAEEIEMLKEGNRKLKEEQTRQSGNSRELRKMVDDAKKETKTMRDRLDTMKRAHSELFRDIDWEKNKRRLAERRLQECLAAQKAIAEKYGALTKRLR